ncbi:MAG: SpoIIE family protein phosphatase [Endomicrobiia bacterium]
MIILTGLIFFRTPFIVLMPYFQSGLALELVFFTIGLGKRFQYVEAQKQETQKKLIEELKIREEFQLALNQELEEIVNERTQEIYQSKEEIEAQKSLIEINNSLLERTNKQLTDNLKYAGFIQQALLQDIELLRPYFSDMMLFYKPHSFISGDFYKYYHINKYSTIIIVADCTGHGVPGAMLTIIAQDFLDDIILNHSITSPQQILVELEHRITSRLLDKNMNENLSEGLDIAIILINRKANEILFSGAKLPLILIQDNNIIRIKGEIFGIGGNIHNRKNLKTFTLHSLTFKNGDILYLYTDGFQDQLHYITGKKFLSTRFRDFLQTISIHPFEKQKELLNDKLFEWKNINEQTDDITILGLKF